MKLLKKYILYLIRWQLSTPILAIVLYLLSNMSTLWATIIANFIGGLIFFWIDKLIFKNGWYTLEEADSSKVGEQYNKLNQCYLDLEETEEE